MDKSDSTSSRSVFSIFKDEQVIADPKHFAPPKSVPLGDLSKVPMNWH